MRTKILGLLAVGLLAAPMAANAVVVTWDVNATNSCEYSATSSGGVACTYSSITPQSFSVAVDINETPTSSSGPSTYSSNGGSYAYTQRYANSNFSVQPGLSTAVSPFAAILDSYLTYPGTLGTYAYASGGDYYVDYSFGGSDYGTTYFNIVVGKYYSSCTPSCGGSAYSVTGYQQYLSLQVSNATLNSALTDVTSLTLANYLALLNAPGSSLSFYNYAVDWAYNVTSGSAFYTKYSGRDYRGTATAAVAVPEPGTLALLGLGLLGIGLTRRKAA